MAVLFGVVLLVAIRVSASSRQSPFSRAPTAGRFRLHDERCDGISFTSPINTLRDDDE
jgi:hypothetical protein